MGTAAYDRSTKSRWDGADGFRPPTQAELDAELDAVQPTLDDILRALKAKNGLTYQDIANAKWVRPAAAR